MVKLLAATAFAMFLCGLLTGTAIGLRIPEKAAPTLPGHTARDDAAIMALRSAFEAPSGHNWEYSGSLALVSGKILISPLRTMQQSDQSSFDLRTLVPGPTATLVGLFHTHPCMPETHAVPYYSPTDLGTLIAFRVASYILDECTGNVHVLDINTDDINATLVAMPGIESVVPIYLTQGRIIGNIGEHGVDLNNVTPTPQYPKANEQTTPQPPAGWRKTFRRGAWGQGENPGIHKCGPHQIAMYIIADDGTVFFLECLRDHVNGEQR